jgi:hypothetical protein
MTDDQQFILAIVTLLVPTSASILAFLQGRQTHGLVDGMTKRSVRRARAQGAATMRSVLRDAPQVAPPGDGPSTT